MKNLVMGGTAGTDLLFNLTTTGIIGACCTYPLDLIKTRLQNQKVGPNGEVMYKGVLDAFAKIVKSNGLTGLYRGLPAQLVIIHRH
jgi:solute carrier family 25 (mitochondrial glutamate transporter), member 18/22